jgi:hypothetical protein
VRAARSVGIQLYQAGARTGGAQGNQAQRLKIDELSDSEIDNVPTENVQKTHPIEDSSTPVLGSPNTVRTGA